LANQGETTFLAATIRAADAAPLMLATGEPVMALGGFTGGDPILSADELAALVAKGTVRFFLMPPPSPHQGELTRWVADHCAPVPPGKWQSPAPGPGKGQRLFDCG